MSKSKVSVNRLLDDLLHVLESDIRPSKKIRISIYKIKQFKEKLAKQANKMPDKAA